MSKTKKTPKSWPTLDLPPNTSIETAKLELAKCVNGGVMCPVCDRVIKEYGRAMRWAWALSLIYIYNYFQQHPEEKYVHIWELLRHTGLKNPTSGDFVKTRFWGFIEPMPMTEPTKDGHPRSGRWSMTKKGSLFVQGLLRVPKKVVTFKNELLGFAGEEITIKDIAHGNFNYTEVVLNPAPRPTS